MKFQFLSLILCFLMIPALAAGYQGTNLGELRLSDNSVPADGTISYIVFMNGTDDELKTEDGYNSQLGLDQGYEIVDIPPPTGYRWFQYDGFANTDDGTAWEIQFRESTNGEYGTQSGTVQSSFDMMPVFGLSTPPPAMPDTPQNLSASQNASDKVELTWTNETGMTYRVYRAVLESGALNGHSNGFYDRMATGVTSPWVDNTSVMDQDYWYIIIADDGTYWSAHSEEVHIKMTSATATPVPTNTDTPIPTNTDTPIPTNTDTPIPTNTDTPAPTETNTPVPTETPNYTATPIPTETPTPTPGSVPISGGGSDIVLVILMSLVLITAMFTTLALKET